MERLVKTSLEVGMTLPWTVFTEDGEILLSEGSSIRNERVLGLLIGRGAWCLNDEIEKRCKNKPAQESSDQTRTLSAFKQLEVFRDKLQILLQTIVSSPEPKQKDSIHEYAGELQTLSWKYSDMILGALILDKESPYSKLHPIMASAVSAMIAKRLDLEPDMIHLITCANMTANLGMYEIQDELAEQDGELTETQQQQIRQHPQKSHNLLTSIGVTDETWLEIILKHHENMDGTGYPGNLKADSIPEYVRISTLADMYAAMVLPRRYRDGIHCQQAIKQIFSQRAHSLDENLTNLFIKDIGVYPPGAWTELSNGDKGIVIKRGLKTATQPTVSCLYDKQNDRYNRPRIRNLADARGLTIKQISSWDGEPEFSLEDIWGFV